LDAGADLLVLVGHLYDAAIDPSLWGPTLRRISDSCHALGMALFVMDAKRRQVLFRAAHGPSREEDAQAVCDEVTLSHGVETSLSDSVDLATRGRALRYTFRVPLDEKAPAGDYFIVRFWFRTAEIAARSPRSGLRMASGDNEALSRWRVLEPHVRRALRIGQELAEMEARAGAANVAEALSCGLLVLDGRGSVRRMNQPAKAHVARGNGLVVTNDGVLATARGSDQQALSGLLARALGPCPSWGLMALARPDSPYPYVLRVLPLDVNARRKDHERLAAALLIREPSLGADIPPNDLRLLFDLTAREAELASRLAHAEQLTEAAAQLGVSVKTARHYLETIFRKTGVRRQAELIALIDGFACCQSWAEHRDPRPVI